MSGSQKSRKENPGHPESGIRNFKQNFTKNRFVKSLVVCPYEVSQECGDIVKQLLVVRHVVEQIDQCPQKLLDKNGEGILLASDSQECGKEFGLGASDMICFE